MSEHSLEKSAPVPWRVPVAVHDIPEEGRHFVLVPDSDTRASIARLAGLRDLPRLEADFDVTRHGGDGLHVVGRVSATVGQTCVVSLEPLANNIEEDVDLLFIPKSAADSSATEVEKSDARAETKWDEPEALVGGVVDLGLVATEFLILGLDPYPRKAGVVFDPPQNLKPDGGPFAALAGWSKDRNEH
ncbi:MAG TPA: YceD family protein [Xanthobacteraceae bacterium]|nr:YceD family protein [Xanthobacteraceae bacterium]